MAREQIHFVTGKLAEHALREQLAELAPQIGFGYTIDVLNITVAALMTTDWVAQRIQLPSGTSRVLLPGYCRGDIALLAASAGVPVGLGPHDLRRLPEFFGREADRRKNYGAFDIEILAEINHAPRLPLREILATAAALKADGADRIDVGCNPGETWPGVGE